MKGSNELRLNEATIIEALQMWLDKKMPDGLQMVKSVSLSAESYGTKTFSVLVEEKEAK